MRSLFTILSILIVQIGLAQGLEESFDANCNCWVITNHYDNGQVSMVHHENVDRQKDGELKHFSPEGSLLRKEIWEDGKLDGTTVHYHPDGSVYLEANYENGKKVGTWTFRDTDGTPSQEITYFGKGSDGVYAHFHAGVRYAEQVIQDGKLVDTKILNQEIYQVVQEESAASEK